MYLSIFVNIGIRLFSTSDTLNTVVVSATRQQTISTEVPIAISEQKIKQYALNTPEAISNISGVFMQRTNQGGGSAFVRGLTGNQTLLVLDGVRFNNSTFRYGPNQYLNTIDPFNLDKVEVVMGSGSVQYGSDALTGAIHLFTLQPTFKETPTWSGQHMAKWAIQGMEKSILNRVNFQSYSISAIFSASFKDFGDISRGGNNALQHPTGYNESNLLTKIRFKISPKWELETLFQQNEQLNVPVFHKIQLENFAINEMSLQRYQRGYLKLNANLHHKWFKSVEIISSLQRSLENRTLQKNASNTTRYESDYIQTGGLTLQIRGSLSQNHTSTTGMEGYGDWINSSRKDVQLSKTTDLRALYPNNSTYFSFSAFSLHEWQTKNWFIHSGIRVQQSTAVIPDTTVGKSTISKGAIVYDWGTSYAISKNNRLFFNYSTSFRAPNMDDLGSVGIVDFRYEQPAYHLKPEYAINKTFGLKHSNDVWTSEWIIFHTQLKNLISRRKTGEMIQSYPVYIKENIDEAYLYGFEMTQAFWMSPYFQIKNQVSFTYGQNSSQNEPMRRIPPLHGNVQLIYQKLKWYVGINWLFAAKQNRLSAADKSDNRINPNGTPGWGILNIDVKYPISSKTSIRMQGINLNNVPYRMHGSGIDGIGRSVWLQLILEW